MSHGNHYCEAQSSPCRERDICDGFHVFFVLIGNSLNVESVSLSGRVFVPRTKSKATGFLDW